VAVGGAGAAGLGCGVERFRFQSLSVSHVLVVAATSSESSQRAASFRRLAATSRRRRRRRPLAAFLASAVDLSVVVTRELCVWQDFSRRRERASSASFSFKQLAASGHGPQENGEELISAAPK
jgi:hypothetical protein